MSKITQGIEPNAWHLAFAVRGTADLHNYAVTEEVGELIKDQFISELLPFVAQLNGMQMSSVLAQVRDMTLRPRRSA